MPTDNVVPIDAEVARSMARRAVKFRWFVAGLTAVWLGALIPVLLFTPLPPLMPFLVLGALLVLAEHRFVLFGDETSMSGSIIVAIASVFVFVDTAPLAGPMLVASLGGLYLPHLRQREFGLALANGAGFGLSALGAAVSVLVLGHQSSDNWPATGTLVLLAVSIDWLINSGVVGGASSVRGATPLARSVRVQITSDTDVLMLAFAVGALTVMNADHSLPVVALGICVALAAFEIKLLRHQRFDVNLGRRRDRIFNASLVATTVFALCAEPGLGALALASLALFLVQATDHLMGVPTASGFAACIAIGSVAFALPIPLILVALVLLLAACGAIEATCIAARANRAGSRLSLWTGMGLLAVGRRELCWLVAIAVVIAALAPIYEGQIGSPLPLGVALVALAALTVEKRHVASGLTTSR